jgi:chromosome segregation ATPase
MFGFFRRKRKQEEVVEPVPMQVMSVEELFANIEKLKEQFLAVRDDLAAREDRIAVLEGELEEERKVEEGKDEEIAILKERVEHLEGLLGQIDELAGKK